MLAKRGIVDIVNDLIVDCVGAAGDMAYQSSAAANRVKQSGRKAGLGQRLTHERFTQWQLIHHARKARECFRRVGKRGGKHLGLVFVDGDFRRGGAGVDDEQSHAVSSAYSAVPKFFRYNIADVILCVQRVPVNVEKENI